MIKFTGDRTTDRIMNIWAEWFGKKHNCEDRLELLEDKDLNRIMYEVGMEDFVAFVLEEFPQMENVGYEYDAESTWEMFLNDTKVGYDVEEALSEFLGSYVVDNALVSEYIDRDYIAEAYTDGDLDKFFEKDPIGKKLYSKDRKAFVDAFVDFYGEFTNGFGFGIDEYVEVVMSENDDEGHTYDDIRKYINANWKDPRYWVYDGYIYNPRLYNGEEIHCVIKVDLEEIAKNADLKGKKSVEDDENVIPF